MFIIRSFLVLSLFVIGVGTTINPSSNNVFLADYEDDL
jgi:hypothetical protein